MTKAVLVNQLSVIWSNSGARQQFKHPDREAIARIISASPGPVGLFFNYDTKFTSYWRNPPKQPYAFTVEYGEGGYLAVTIPELPLPQ